MKKLMIAAATVALTAPAFAQDQPDATTTDPAAVPTEETTTAPGLEPTGVLDPAAQPATDPVMTTPTADPAMTVTDHASATVTAAQPGVTASWLTSRSIWTTNQPSSTAWVDVTVSERPSEWEQIADVSDLVLTDDGHLVGYTADIGGFLGMGVHTVLLDRDTLHVVRFGDDAYLVTNYTREELEAMPEFDTELVHD
ncbi:MAG: PRC-barrel domain-containing protein [Paracoccus sp. (in: a-proteobacteria)]|uniref:PRC-barrel domain-containing protein n=1 Tax=Paracoccus sp. TaxID=267 RepID=UPI0026E02323|nr:PRC-barrel domain-containing protein [Paracoccus sp. (in: a-proteobacteria)]MDO5631587.1 PRC-barrel domain-containing protein [Paracoccus sp. (in: a-proteobacteria)]